jgi:adenylosuccinate synthase
VLWLPELEKEIRQVGLTPDRLFIDGQAMMIDRVDRGREERTLRSKIGSTAQGVGWATARKVLRGAIGPRVRLARDEPRLSDYVRDTVGVIETALADEQRVLLEGTQGTALSLHHGDYPFVTSRVTTASGCLAEAGIPASRVRRTLMVCRSFPIRVESPRGSTSGPMSREIDFDELARQCDYTAEHLRNAERTSTTNRLRRIGHFDWPLFRRSVTLNGPTDIALTFADYIGHGNQNARRFEQLNDETTEFIAEVERAAAAPVSLIAVRFHYRAIIDRRMW